MSSLGDDLFDDTWGGTADPAGGEMAPADAASKAGKAGKAGKDTESEPVIHGEDYPTALRPIVFVPGILGSSIRHRGTAPWELWPPTNVGGPASNQGTHELFRDIKALVRLDHGSKQPIGPFPIVYDHLLSTLNELRGKRNFHPFWYDWTQSNRNSARELIDHVKSVLARPEYVAADIHAVDVVCHSMGGLVFRAAYQRTPDIFRRFVFLAVPAWGAPKAFFVLHPKADLPLFTTFFEGFVAGRVWNAIRSADDESTIEAELKYLGCRLPSVYELLPDRFYLHARVMVSDNQATNRRPVRGLDETYYDSEWGFPNEMRPGVRKAMEFKAELGADYPGSDTDRLIIYSSQKPTMDTVDYDDYVLDFDYDTPKASSLRNGDATVPALSATAGNSAQAVEVNADHSGLPELGDTRARITRFLQRPPE